MTANHEIKSQLAKLLATEDLVVEHKKISSACFNVHTRVLTLPMWQKASNFVYDMLVGHEVGHALYTSYEDWKQDFKIPKSIMNIVEDARIEKLMKRRYAGISKTFYNGYKELSDEDFFSISDTNLDEMNLADRANLWFKIGHYINVPIERGEEMKIINMIADAETFQDVVDASKALYEFCKTQEENELQDPTKDEFNSDSRTESGNESSSETMDFGSDENKSDEPVEIESDQSYGGTAESEPLNQSGDDYVPEVKTMDALNDAIEKLVDLDGNENHYLEIPKLNLDTVIIKNENIHKYIFNCWKELELDCFSITDNEFLKFKNNSKKEVSYLVKEFECKKSADQYARSSTARTGVLNTTKLHTYKFNEDLFKKISVIPDGKNHGLVFILDWSGSMNRVMIDTLKQLYNILWFCKKVNIPFDVYAFTEEWNYHPYKNFDGTIVYPEQHYEKIENVFCVDRGFSLLNMFTSKVSSKDLEQQMRNIFRIAYSFNNYTGGISVPPQLSLSGTPLNESLIALHQIIPEFKTRNKLQKTHCIILTDGEAKHVNYHVKVSRPTEQESYMGTRRIGHTCFLRNRKTGMVYKIGESLTTTLLQDLKATFPEVNFIGIRIIASRDAGYFIRANSSQKNYDTLQSQWRKERSVTLTESGYHKYFAMSSSALSNEIDFVVDEDATKSAIKNAFKKSLNSKKMNKKFLNEFIELVA